MTKRSASPAFEPNGRVKPTPIQPSPFKILNLNDGETVNQTCILIHGECQAFDSAETNFVSVTSADMLHRAQTAHHWPLNNGQWRALALLAPGTNVITFDLHHAGEISSTLRVTVNYIPLLQLPPLHLAILVAKDSPLLTDCPPAKYGAISTAHSSIDAAIAKLRMSAYMWQALTAEDFRQKGLGRRSFRLEEEWSPNMTVQASHRAHSRNSRDMGTVAKVHIIPSEKTVAQLRHADVAQQNPHGRDRDGLHRYFEAALAKFGPPFEAKCRPVVAGMILDTHYSTAKSMILGHAALGCHKPDGISLGIFGSHLTYSWPRFLEEVPACLTDMSLTGSTVGNDNGECETMRGACFVGQGAFLHEVGHAFGAQHTTGIMARGYSKAWGINFVAHETNNDIENDAKWDLQEALKFRLMPHFALPGDEHIPTAIQCARVKIQIDFGTDRDDTIQNDDSRNEGLHVSSEAGLAQVKLQSGTDDPIIHDFMHSPEYKNQKTLRVDDIRGKFDQSKPLTVTALGMNGNQHIIADLWTMLKERPFITIPGSNMIIHKQSVRSQHVEAAQDSREFVRWAMLLRRRGRDNQLHRATSIDLRVGATMDGAVVYYADGNFANCGPMLDRHTGQPHVFGGGESERRDLPVNQTVTRVRIRKDDSGWGSLAGIRMSLSNGDEWGHLNDYNYHGDGEEEDEPVITLEPGDGEAIVGFYGQSDTGSGFTHEFGILTAQEGVDLPDNVYDLPEFSNAQ
ncbi:hypothetical protein N7457_005237 [Penicillium paradoxum]|uniref:uncharacterized protein n=1 Tax=Penicillium paradoxum TaxID=176176 RepID=UPI0025469F2F|nr:uncharacterized protein N7457_005237 [Penicillium paradoxum]KAJ5780077.1 hypothetical protein N7457_005237 [Penicillium paradoxum]